MKVEWMREIKKGESISKEKIIEILLKNRNIKDKQGFLNPPSPLSIQLSYFGFKKELHDFISLLTVIKNKKQRIVVYTDYDADGITGGTIMWETLYLLGFDVMPYVPHRKHEGYGFSEKGIDRVKKEFDPALIISVDHGISGTNEITYAASLGIQIVVTDHHLAPEKKPDKAHAIFHIPALSGSGVAYFVAKEIYTSFKSILKTNDKRLSTYFEVDYLVLAAIGTIADLIPLTGPSRSIVYHGLHAFKKTKRTGIKHIISEAKITDKAITPYEVGFIIAPRINAVGRLEHALDALRLLCTHNDKQAKEIASKIGGTNKERQDLVTDAVKEAKQMVEKIVEKDNLPLIILLHSTRWNEGIIGLIASKIAETYSRPTIVLTKSDGFWKGSARSVNDFHITEFLRSMEKRLISVGGHKGAAGFSIVDSELDGFRELTQKQIKKIAKEKDFEKTIIADMKIPLSLATSDLAKELEKLAPFGVGNPNPSFVSEVTILEKKTFGKKGEHIKFFVKDTHAESFPIELIAFYKAEEYKKIIKGNQISAVYCLDINRWNGRESLRGKILQIY
ncbi:MAG: single-stranded-DNA-specific exonuclease RecJ [Patescibacteria group bacterium]